MSTRIGRRLVWLAVLALPIWGLLGWRLYTLQIVNGHAYARIAHEQRALSLPVAGSRGRILDRDGVPLHDPEQAWGVAVFPPLVKDEAATARALAEALGGSELKLDAAIRGATGPAWVATELSAEAATQVSEMGLPGIAVGQPEERYGPGALARHLVGMLNGSTGAQGLEALFEPELSGEAIPSLVAYRDARSAPMAGLGIRETVAGVGKQPYDLHTTIDRSIQRTVEDVLDAHHVGAGAVVVLEPQSGEVLAMASRPTFEYGAPATGKDDGRYLNRALVAYPPGSVFKPILAAAALESGVVELDEEFQCDGHYELGPNTFHDALKGGHGTITFADAVGQSCNVVFLETGYERLGVDGMREAAALFGFGTPTDFAGRPWSSEAEGHVPDLSEDSAVQMAFGQGSLRVTPVQLARAFAAIANGGVLPDLKLVRVTKNPAGEVMWRPPAGRGERIISKQTALQVQRALARVTSPSGKGTGKQAWLEEAGAAGKTGSAEHAPGKKAHAWFAGYFPVAEPRYVVVVLVEEGEAGGVAAAPIFREIGERILAQEEPLE